jgi:glycosyltransferase involved in cell wall biosynthesis
VRLGGHVSDVASFLSQLDVFVLPSRSEAHPIALLEAMGCGLPCVGTRVGGIPEVLDDGNAGLLVADDDESSLGEVLAELAGDPDMRARLGRAARERVCRRYSLDAMIDRYVRLYEDLTGG